MDRVNEPKTPAPRPAWNVDPTTDSVELGSIIMMSLEHVELHPSSEIVLPSSHCSPGSMIPLPHSMVDTQILGSPVHS